MAHAISRQSPYGEVDRMHVDMLCQGRHESPEDDHGRDRINETPDHQKHAGDDKAHGGDVDGVGRQESHDEFRDSVERQEEAEGGSGPDAKQ